MVSGRPGPILLDVPMDVLADSAEVLLPDPDQREARGRVRPAADDVERAAALLRDAKRPVIVAGGGAITAEASAEVTALAERLGAPVVTTWNGKGAIDETHELAGLTIGDTASIVGQRARRRTADVLLSVGNRFTDWSASSYRAGVTFAIPPTQLIQLDIDPREIGKNYPVEVGLVGDAKAGLADLLAALGPGGGRCGLRGTAVLRRRSQQAQGRLVRAGRDQVGLDGDADDDGPGRPRGPGGDARGRDRRDRRRPPAGHGQAALGHPRAADPHHVGRVLDDGLRAAGRDRRPAGACPSDRSSRSPATASFLQSMQELQTAVLAGTPVCAIVLDNSGWISIKGGQETFFGRSAWTDFRTPDGSLYSPDFADIGARVRPPQRARRRPDEVAPAVRRALASGGPSLVHVTVDRDLDDRRPRQDGLVGRPEPGIPSRAARAMGGRRGRGAAPMTALARDVGRPARPPLHAATTRRCPAGRVDRDRADPLEQRRPGRAAPRDGRR